MASNDLFTGINAVILEPGLGKARKKILSKKLEEKGGVSSDIFSSSVTHVLVGGSVKYTRIPTLLKVKENEFKHVQILQADWISKCLTEGKLVDTISYKVTPPSDTNSCRMRPPSDTEAVPPSIKNEHGIQSSNADEQQTTESPQTTPTKQHLAPPVKGSPVKKSKIMVDSDDSDYVDSDDGCHVTTAEHDIATDPPPAKKSKVL